MLYILFVHYYCW